MLTAALAVPPLVEWSNFRADFEREASRLLGRPVAVAGATNARLLPWPKIEFEDVTIGGTAGEQPLLALERLAFDVEIAPLLKGDVRIVEMELDRPVGRLEIGADGRIDWLAGEGALTLDPADVSIERLTVREGALTVRDAARSGTFELTRLDADLTADSLAGPWRGEGGFDFRGRRYDASGTTGNVRREGGTARISTRLTLEPEALPYELTATGPVTIDGSGASFDGSFAVEPRRKEDGSLEGAPVTVEGRLTIDRERANMPLFVASVGSGDDPYRLEGRAEALFSGEQRYSMRLQGAQVDVDRIAAPDAPGGVAASDRLALVADVLRQVPLPSVPGDIKLELPAIVAGDTVVRELSADVRPRGDGTGWDVPRFQATLPGRTLLEASGRLAVPQREGDGLGFEGRMLLASRQPSGFATWLSGDVDEGIRRLGSAGFEADVRLGGGSARFDDLELRLGEDVLRGTLARLGPQGEGAPRILANLEGTRIDVETLRGLFELAVGEPADASDLRRHDLDLRLQVESASAANVEARAVDLIALYEKGDLSIDRLKVGRVEGLSLDLSGTVVDLAERPKGRLNGTVAVENPVAALAALSRVPGAAELVAHLRREPALVADSRFDVSVEAASAALAPLVAVELDGRLGTTAVRVAGRYDGLDGTGDPRIELDLNAINDEPVALLRQLGLGPAQGELAGPGELSLEIGGRPSALRLEAALSTPDGRIATEGASSYVEGQGDVYDGTFTLVGRDIEPLLTAARLAVPGVGEGMPVDLRGSITADAERIGVDGVTGRIRGVPVEASLVLDLDVDPRPRLDGQLTVGAVDLERVLQLALGPRFDLNGREEDGAFGRATLAGLDGDLLLEADRAVLLPGADDMDAATDLRAELLVSDGNLSVENLKAGWLGGKLEGSASIARAGPNAVIGADLTLRGADAEKTGLVDAQAPRVAGSFDLELAVESQARTGAALVGNLSGAATVNVEEARIRGLSPDVLRSVLNAADAVDDAELEKAAPGIARDLVLSGEADVADVQLPFIVANGTARASNVPVRIGGADLVADLRIDLSEPAASGSLRGTFAVPEGEQGVTGVTPDFRISFAADRERQTASLDATTLTTYLTTRLRERREREFAAQRAAILERQRLVRAMRLSREREKRDTERLRARGEGEELPG